MTAILRREVSGYFKGVLGYLFAAFMLVFNGIYTMAYNLSGAYANYEYVLDSISFLYIIAVPILSMRSVAEEKRQRTDQLLYSPPIRMSDVIFGKYLAMLAVLAVPTLIMALMPVLLSSFGTVGFGPAYGTLIAFFLLGATLLSIGLFVSCVTESQVAAAVISLLALLVMYFFSSLASFVPTDGFSSFVALCVIVLLFAFAVQALARNALLSGVVAVAGVGGLYLWYQADASAFSGLFGDIMEKLSVFDRFYTFVDGVFDVTAIVYFISIIAVFLFLSVQALEKRRWSE